MAVTLFQLHVSGVFLYPLCYIENVKVSISKMHAPPGKKTSFPFQALTFVRHFLPSLLKSQGAFSFYL